MNAATAKDAWSILRVEFHEKLRATKLRTLRREFEFLKMKDFEAVKDYCSRILEIVSQMKAYKEDISDKKVVEKILMSIPFKYNPIVSIIQETKDLSTLSAREIMELLEANEQRLNRYEETAQIKGRVRKKKGEETAKVRRILYISLKPNKINIIHVTFLRKQNLEKNSWHWRKLKCHYCKKFGHVEKNCWNKNKQANLVEESDDEQCFF